MSAAHALAAALVFTGLVMARGQEARELAFRMAATYASQGFYFSEAAAGEAAGSYKLLLPVKAGLEYLVLLASDEAASNAAVRAEDDTGRLLQEDTRPGPLAGIRFSPAADGTAVIVVTLRRASGPVGWCVVTGRRAPPRPEPPPEEESVTGAGD